MSEEDKTEEVQEEQESEIESFISAVVTEMQDLPFGDELLVAEDDVFEGKRIRCSSESVNIATGGGWPIGRISELHGKWSSGKSLLVADMLGCVQKIKGDEGIWDKGIGILMDSEGAYDKTFGREATNIRNKELIKGEINLVNKVFDSLIVVITKIRISQMEAYIGEYNVSGESEIKAWVRKGKKQISKGEEGEYGLLWQDMPKSAFDVMSGVFAPIGAAVDSIGALTAMEEQRSLGDDSGYQTERAKVITKAMRVMTIMIKKASVCMIMTNHAKQKFNVSFGDQTTTPGGDAVPFHASIRGRLRVVKWLKDDGKTYGARLHMKVVKNKTAPPHRECEFDIRFDVGFDKFSGLVKSLTDLGVLEKDGQKYEWLEYPDVVMTKAKWRSEGFLEYPEVFTDIKRL